jgi:hypothetical protein
MSDGDTVGERRMNETVSWFRAGPVDLVLAADPRSSTAERLRREAFVERSAMGNNYFRARDDGLNATPNDGRFRRVREQIRRDAIHVERRVVDDHRDAVRRTRRADETRKARGGYREDEIEDDDSDLDAGVFCRIEPSRFGV